MYLYSCFCISLYCLSVFLLMCLCFCLSLFVHLLGYSSLDLSVTLSVSVSFCFSMLSFCISVYMHIHKSVCQVFCLNLNISSACLSYVCECVFFSAFYLTLCLMLCLWGIVFSDVFLWDSCLLVSLFTVCAYMYAYVCVTAVSPVWVWWTVFTDMCVAWYLEMRVRDTVFRGVWEIVFVEVHV